MFPFARGGAFWQAAAADGILRRLDRRSVIVIDRERHRGPLPGAHHASEKLRQCSRDGDRNDGAERLAPDHLLYHLLHICLVVFLCSRGSLSRDGPKCQV